jgi:hypothetical protein
VGEALGLPTGSDSAAVTEALGGLRTVLVFLDNVEHGVKVLAPQVQTWRFAAPGVVFVLTSREARRLRREQVMPGSLRVAPGRRPRRPSTIGRVGGWGLGATPMTPSPGRRKGGLRSSSRCSARR